MEHPPHTAGDLPVRPRSGLTPPAGGVVDRARRVLVSQWLVPGVMETPRSTSPASAARRRLTPGLFGVGSGLYLP